MDQIHHDLLIRIDERTTDIARRVEKIEGWSEKLPCQTQKEKVRTLEKITWLGVGASVVAITKSFWGALTP